jgi:hypothetical protein
MGPDPKAGLRMKLDMDKKVITIYDPETKAFKDITFDIVTQKMGLGKDDPLVAGKKLPAVDKEKKTLTRRYWCVRRTLHQCLSQKLVLRPYF